jgi:hypothetical protein
MNARKLAHNERSARKLYERACAELLTFQLSMPDSELPPPADVAQLAALRRRAGAARAHWDAQSRKLEEFETPKQYRRDTDRRPRTPKRRETFV